MSTFTDTTGRAWHIHISVDEIKRVRTLLGEDLTAIDDIVPRLMNDPILLTDVLWAVLKPQADAANVTAEDFARAMAGDTIAAAKDAFFAEYIRFFPNQNQRDILRAAMAKGEELNHLLTQLIIKKIEKTELPKEILAALSPPSTESQARSE